MNFASSGKSKHYLKPQPNRQLDAKGWECSNPGECICLSPPSSFSSSEKNVTLMEFLFVHELLLRVVDFFNYRKKTVCLKSNIKCPKEQPTVEVGDDIWMGPI